MQFNLFLWIREGVKQSVLLGVSDAIEAIGTPDNSEDISPRLLEFMRQDSGDSATSRVAGEARRKRLGKSLKDLETPA
ncbi:MAG: hypothetical protein KJ000_25320 [Pirellulaceae bacterium]|jgi:hypothetical protein|nr:hypothetical protein [Pirellulaceae bacterium]